jgi:uncharacterized protein YbcI
MPQATINHDSAQTRQTPAEPAPGEPRNGAITGVPGPDVTPAPPANRHSPTLEIANSIVRLHKQTFGRGPTKANAQFAGTDILIILLADAMTIAERNLLALGEHERLREHRLFLEHALEHEMRSLVERILDRRTIAFIPGLDAHRDIATVTFTLEPNPENPTSNSNADPPHPEQAAAAG